MKKYKIFMLAGAVVFANAGTQLAKIELLSNVFLLHYPRKISWARIYSASYWFHSALKKS